MDGQGQWARNKKASILQYHYLVSDNLTECGMGIKLTKWIKADVVSEASCCRKCRMKHQPPAPILPPVIIKQPSAVKSVCPFCKTHFSYLDDFNVHMRTHEKPSKQSHKQASKAKPPSLRGMSDEQKEYQAHITEVIRSIHNHQPKPTMPEQPTKRRDTKDGRMKEQCSECHQCVCYKKSYIKENGETILCLVAYDVDASNNSGERHICDGVRKKKSGWGVLSGGGFETNRRRH